MTVVGVVDDVRYRGLTDPRLDVYLPAAQSTARVQHLMVRTTSDPELLFPAIRTLARELDPAVYVGESVMMSDVVARESAPWRFAMRVLSAFGVLAALLATVGLVGMVTLAVTLRRRELGIRAALGATPARLRQFVLAEALLTCAPATVVGLIGALMLGRLAAGLLVDTAPHDAVSLGGAAVLTVIAGMTACLLPAHRAAVTDPAVALRE
jgi:ABC-type antimicrobial peptide transport system permease subunit